MKVEVSEAIEEIKRQFGNAQLQIEEDGEGGARVIMEPVQIGEKFRPQNTWFGFHITALYPYADIYPVFIGADVSRVDGVEFAPPITKNHNFMGRQAIQVSRRNVAADKGTQTAAAKVLKILHFLENLT